ncbi:bbs2, partial [Acrasis kona]
DGEHPVLTAVSSAGKILLHNPHEKNADNHIRFLNMNRDINSICSGTLNPKLKRDVLLVGTETNLLGYDVHNNADIFYREVQDGLNTMMIGRIGAMSNNLVIVGGNCSIQGYDHEGGEQYWNTTGGNVTSLEFIDVDEDGQKELLVGSDDYTIYIYKEEEVLSEVPENDQVVKLCGMRFAKYGYGLGNGTIGLYDKDKRVWRVKTNHTVHALGSYDLDDDGIPELVVGWSDGKVEVRHENNGSVIYKDQFQNPISDIVRADYRMDKKEEIMVCAYNGEVRGYLPAQNELAVVFDNKIEEAALAELVQKKEDLLYELKSFEENLRKIKSGETDPSQLKSTTKVNCSLKPKMNEKCVSIVFDTNPENIFKMAIVYAEQLFESDCCMIYAKEPTNTIEIDLAPTKDISIVFSVQALVGQGLGDTFQVYELKYTLPRFSLYLPVTEFTKQQPKSEVSFKINDRVARIIIWVNASFNITYPPEQVNKDLDIKFLSIRDGLPLHIKYEIATGRMTIRVDSMEIAGDIVQDICTSMGIKEMESTCSFPDEFRAFEDVLSQVDSFNTTRLKMSAEMADSSQAVKTLVIKAEDARMLGDMKYMRGMYKDLYDMNNDLTGEFKKRANNHEHLLEALKEVNFMIQKASKLRFGEAKRRVVNEARTAIKNNNTHHLFKILMGGNAE